MVELPYEDLGFVDVELLPVCAPRSIKKGINFGDEVGWSANKETWHVDG